MPGKARPEKRPLPLKTRQIFNTRGSILTAMLPGTPGSLASMKLSKPKPKPRKDDGRKTIMPVPPKKGKRPSNRNDIIRNRIRP